MTYLLSFLTMFFLVWYLTKSKTAGIVSGVFYALSPYHIAHYIFPSLYNMQWLPLMFLSLFILTRVNTMSKVTVNYNTTYSLMFCSGGRCDAWGDSKPTVTVNNGGRCNAIVVIIGLIWSVIAYSDAYYGFMAMVVAITFFLWHRIDFKRLCQFLLVCMIIILPFVIWSYGDWGKRLVCDPVPVIANWYDYFNPDFFGKGVEHSLFIFPLLWILAGLGIKKSLREASFFWWLLVFAFILSVIEPLCPIFRVSARWGVMVLLSICVLSGYGVKWIEKRL